MHITDNLKWVLHTHTVWWRRCNSASSTSGGGRNLAWPWRPLQSSTDAPLRAPCRAVSPPGKVIASSTTAGLSRGWCGQPIASPGTLPALQDIYSTRCHRKAKMIIKNLSRPSHGLFTPLPSRRRRQYRCNKAGAERLSPGHQNVKESLLALVTVLVGYHPVLYPAP